MVRKNNQSRVYIGLDSDVLRCLSYIHYLNQPGNLLNKDDKMEAELSETTFLRYINSTAINISKKEYFTAMYNDVVNDKYRIFISEPVYFENKHSTFICDFINQYCYMPKLDKTKKDFECIKEVEQLAQAYTSPRVEERDGETKQYKPAMEKRYSAAMRKYIPTNDVYIMAWCTCYGCQLLTFNGKHFIYYNKGQNNYRRMSIRSINEQMEYVLEVINDKTLVSAAYEWKETLSKYDYYDKTFNFDYTKNLDMFFEKASLITTILDKKYNDENDFIDEEEYELDTNLDTNDD